MMAKAFPDAPRSAPTRIAVCRLCRSGAVEGVVDLGVQCLTGVFPRPEQPDPTEGPLELGLCQDCGLVQLMHEYDPGEMYGDEYGYRSGLNASMVEHLHRKVRRLEEFVGLAAGDVVVDIGANDGTLLKGYATPELRRVGVDPTIPRWVEFYPDDIETVADFFSAETYLGLAGGGRLATIITSVAMFYDLPDPIAFARDVGRCLSPNGIWHFEQSYLPSMLRASSYDTICHEHVEYYSLTVVERILQEAGLELLDVGFNRVNGGSFAVTAQHAGGPRRANRELIDWFLRQETRLQLREPETFLRFGRRVEKHAADLRDLVQTLSASPGALAGYGASTKGNVLLQFCGFTRTHIPVIGEVNPTKFGCETPGSRIPIESEQDMFARSPSYLLVLPWHFRESILSREAGFLNSGGKLIFPLPEIEIVGD